MTLKSMIGPKKALRSIPTSARYKALRTSSPGKERGRTGTVSRSRTARNTVPQLQPSQIPHAPRRGKAEVGLPPGTVVEAPILLRPRALLRALAPALQESCRRGGVLQYLQEIFPDLGLSFGGIAVSNLRGGVVKKLPELVVG